MESNAEVAAAHLRAMADPPAQHLALLALLKKKGVLDDEDIEQYNTLTNEAAGRIARVLEGMQLLYVHMQAPPGTPPIGIPAPAELLSVARKTLEELKALLPGAYYLQETEDSLNVMDPAQRQRGPDLIDLYLQAVAAEGRRLPGELNAELAGRVLRQILGDAGVVTAEVLADQTGAVEELLRDYGAWQRQQ